jgi:hypothetical protein
MNCHVLHETAEMKVLKKPGVMAHWCSPFWDFKTSRKIQGSKPKPPQKKGKKEGE